MLRVEGIDVADPGAATPFWLDAAALLRARWSSARFFAEIDGGAFVPITQPTFVFRAPRVVVHEVPWAGAVVSIGAGAHFR